MDLRLLKKCGNNQNSPHLAQNQSRARTLGHKALFYSNVIRLVGRKDFAHALKGLHEPVGETGPGVEPKYTAGDTGPTAPIIFEQTVSEESAPGIKPQNRRRPGVASLHAHTPGATRQ